MIKFPFQLKYSSSIVDVIMDGDGSHSNDSVFVELLGMYPFGHNFSIDEMLVNKSGAVFSWLLHKKSPEVEWKNR